jgi:hypothetical protein
MNTGFVIRGTELSSIEMSEASSGSFNDCWVAEDIRGSANVRHGTIGSHNLRLVK